MSGFGHLRCLRIFQISVQGWRPKADQIQLKADTYSQSRFRSRVTILILVLA